MRNTAARAALIATMLPLLLTMLLAAFIVQAVGRIRPAVGMSQSRLRPTVTTHTAAPTAESSHRGPHPGNMLIHGF